MKHQPRVLPVAVVALLANIGCSGGNGPKEASAAKDAPAAAATTSGTVDACALLTQSEVAELVGNPVRKGEPFAGPEVCKWDTDTRGDVTLLLTVRRAGSLREQALCPDIRKAGQAAGFESLGEGSTWKSENVMALFNSGDLELCTRQAYIGLTLNGERDAAALKQKAVAIVPKVSSRLR